MNIRALTLLSCLFLTVKVYGQASMIPTVDSMSNNDLWTALVTSNASGETIFGKCRVVITTDCPGCACPYYFRSNVVGSLGHYGWPKNPSSGDSTGCLGSGCWGGYTPAMCTSDVKANARAVLLDALNNSACGTPVPPNITGGVNISEVSKFYFVDPKNNEGKILCGTTGLGTPVGGVLQFTQLPSSICKAAYHTALKAAANNRGQITFITLEQFNQNTLANQVIQNAAAQVGQLNESYGLHTLKDVQEFVDSNEAQYASMSTEDVALFYVSVGKDTSKLPASVKARVIPEKFDTIRTADQNYIIRSEITAAEEKLSELSEKVVEGKDFTLDEAVNYFKTTSPSKMQKSLD